MSAPVSENELFAALRGYASTLEVQLMIEEELKKFQEKTLPKLLAQAVSNNNSSHHENHSGGDATTRDEAGSSTPDNKASEPAHNETSINTTVPSSSPSSSPPNAEWVQTFLKAHVDDTVARRLPTMIAQEVQRQLRSMNAAAAAATPPPQNDSHATLDGLSSNSTSHSNHLNSTGMSGGSSAVNYTNAGSSAVDLRSSMGLPPLPPPAPASTPPLRPTPTHESVTSSSTASPAAAAAPSPGAGGAANTSSSAADEARRQREQILFAIEDIERQVNSLQRAVDDAVDAQEARGRCWAFFCAALDTRMQAQEDRGAAETLPCLQARLQRQLEDQQAEALLTTLETVMTCLRPQQHQQQQNRGNEESSGVSTPAPRGTAASPNSAEVVAAATAALRHVPSSSPLPQDLPTSTSTLNVERHTNPSNLRGMPPPQQQQQSSSSSPETPPLRTDGPLGRGSVCSSSGEPPSPPPTAPDYAATVKSETTTMTKNAADTATWTAVPAFAAPSSPPLPHFAGLNRGVRAITTRGAAATSTSSASSSVKSLPTTASDAPPILSLTPTSVDVSAGQRGGLGGTAVRRPAPSPWECVDPLSRDQQPLPQQQQQSSLPSASRHHHRQYSPTRTTSPSAAATSSSLLAAARIAVEPVEATTLRRADNATMYDGNINLTLSRLSHTKNSTSPATATAAATVASEPTANARPITLGIDAVNVPAGVLPEALGRHGAVRVQSVTRRQLAEKAGLCRGDVVLSVDGRSVRSCEQLRDVLNAVPPSQDSLTVQLYRHTAHQVITVLLKL